MWFQKIKNRFKALGMMSILFFLFVNCSSHKLGSVLNSDTKNQTNTSTPGNQTTRTPVVPAPSPTPEPDPLIPTPNPQPDINPNPAPTPNPTPAPTQNNSTNCQKAKSFISLHQQPVQNLIGYKNQNTPQRAASGIWLSIPGYSTYSEFKVYIPQGTTYFALTGNQPQSVDFAVVSKFESIPNRVQPLSDEEYNTAISQTNETDQFAKLMAGEEVVFVHNHGGNMSLSGTARLYSSHLQRGGWLYIRVLNGSSIYLLAAVNEVNINVYTQKYNSLMFDSLGDPVDTMCF